MIELKPGDMFRLTRPLIMTSQSEILQVEVSFEVGRIFTVTETSGDHIYCQEYSSTNLQLTVVTYGLDAAYVEDGTIEVLRPLEEDPEEPTEPPTEPENPEEPDMPEREPTSFKLSTYTAKKGRWRPSANIFQLVSTKLSEVKNKPSWVLEEDGAFGEGTENVAKSIQSNYGLSPVDGQVGSGTWKAITPDLGTWRPPLRLRIAECQCSWEAGSKGYGYTGLIPAEGWWNWGIWNVNKGSAKTLTTVGGASYLHPKIDAADAAGNTAEGRTIAEEVAYWFNAGDGRATQVGRYFLEYTVKPSLNNLVKAGWPVERLGFASSEEMNNVSTTDELDSHLVNVSPFIERLILHSCDITVNSGAGGYFPKKSPRCWDQSGSLGWPDEKLPFMDECKQVFADTFGCTIPDNNTYCTSDTRDTYRDALKKCLWEICQNDEQRIMLSAELQARCVIDAWRDMVIGRRRAASWEEGYTFQGSNYCMKDDFGIGI